MYQSQPARATTVVQIAGGYNRWSTCTACAQEVANDGRATIVEAFPFGGGICTNPACPGEPMPAVLASNVHTQDVERVEWQAGSHDIFRAYTHSLIVTGPDGQRFTVSTRHSAQHNVTTTTTEPTGANA